MVYNKGKEIIMNGTVIQGYKNGHIIKSLDKYYFVDSTEASLTGSKGYDSISELVKDREPKKELKTARKSK